MHSMVHPFQRGKRKSLVVSVDRPRCWESRQSSTVVVSLGWRMPVGRASLSVRKSDAKADSRKSSSANAGKVPSRLAETHWRTRQCVKIPVSLHI
jgi:hypothetical protein